MDGPARPDGPGCAESPRPAAPDERSAPAQCHIPARPPRPPNTGSPQADNGIGRRQTVLFAWIQVSSKAFEISMFVKLGEQQRAGPGMQQAVLVCQRIQDIKMIALREAVHDGHKLCAPTC